MNPQDFPSTNRGQIRQTINGYTAFFPAKLPRRVTYSPEVAAQLDEATGSIYRLGGMSSLLPNPDLFIGPPIRLEAVLSSRIEGTKSNVDDLLLYEISTEVPNPQLNSDVHEVSNYATALNHGLNLLTSGLPLSIRLIREVHARLMDGVHDNHATPGEFRKTQNWIGGRTPGEARFVPPPVEEMKVALADWEQFINERPFPLLLQLALAHYQFEVIHPFVDGNGRIGRLLIPLMLYERNVLTQPLLYLSAYFEHHRNEYYDQLLSVSQTGELDSWFLFFLTGINLQSNAAENQIIRISELQSKIRDDLYQKRANSSVLKLADHLFDSPYVTANSVKTLLGSSFPTAQSAIDFLVEFEYLKEVTGRSRDRIYFSSKIFKAIYKKDSNFE